ncbi:MAG TPA: Cys-tRNA(Pro) deacylase [Spirochaetia bacterium]|nr:Cys-tRNA(Pro) deacylase [Spirochaetaceae bacterium]HPE88587.1 Cys-tRNA(Pro) deacylase [Spirochaetales bacterium]HRW25522.1 Cys-tRNA(Pro) deacylase [Spirochaetia bacterium]
MTTNALRLVRSMGIRAEAIEYEVDESDLSAASVAARLGMDPDRVFKTIAVRGPKAGPFLCVVPGSAEVDLKKAAKAAGDKSAEPLPLRELEPLTGYVRGGCSPVGTRKPLPVFIDETAALWDTISVSAGARGLQMALAPDDLARASGGSFADLT